MVELPEPTPEEEEEEEEEEICDDVDATTHGQEETPPKRLQGKRLDVMCDHMNSCYMFVLKLVDML